MQHIRTLVLIVKFAPVAIVVLTILFACSRNENFKNLGKNCNSYSSSPEEYIELCDCYEQNGYTFPDSTVISYVLYKNIADEFGEIYTQVGSGSDQAIINRFRALVTDSSMFRWGEAGTPWNQYKIDFIDSNDEIVNRIKIDPGGSMLWTTPDYGVTKWGGLNDQGFKETMDLIQLIKD